MSNEDFVTVLIKSVKESKFPDCWTIETAEGYLACYDAKIVEILSKAVGQYCNLRLRQSAKGNQYITGAAPSDRLPSSTQSNPKGVSFAGGSRPSDIDAAVILKAVNELVAHGIVKYEDYEKECNVMMVRLRALQTKMKE